MGNKYPVMLGSQALDHLQKLVQNPSDGVYPHDEDPAQAALRKSIWDAVSLARLKAEAGEEEPDSVMWFEPPAPKIVQIMIDPSGVRSTLLGLGSDGAVYRLAFHGRSSGAWEVYAPALQPTDEVTNSGNAD